MLNVNSPTVQMMLSRTPQGLGNIPMYYGNTPTIETTVQPAQPGSAPAIPYPSPKEMLIQQGQANIYNPTGFTPMPRNIVGGYNPGYQAAFTGYSNPYMGYGMYSGFAYPTQPMYPIDQDSRERLEAAQFNGISYDEQLRYESNLYKTMSRVVSKNMDRTDEERDKCEKAFDIYCKQPTREMMQRKRIQPLHIQIKVGNEVIADIGPDNFYFRQDEYTRNASMVEFMKAREEQIEAARVIRNNQLYDSAMERSFDKVELLDFFNNCAGSLMADTLNRQLQHQYVTRTGLLYSSDTMRKMLENNGLRSREQLNAVERFTGRYGIMPDGRPVTPGHDPAIASSFSYNPATGSYEVTAPNFIRDRVEQARNRFITSIPNKGMQ